MKALVLLGCPETPSQTPMAVYVSNKLTKMGYDIDKKKIKIDTDINSLGTHLVTVTLHKKVVFELKVVLVK